jgi:hypothetical protein
LQRHVEELRGYYRWVTTDGVRSPLIEKCFDWLEANWPEQEGPAGLSWGDARIGNTMYEDFQPIAVLDWEMAGIAPREVDLAWMIFLHRFFEDIANSMGLPGMPEFMHRTQIERAYLKAIGLARHEVLIANAYFLPGRRLRQALVHAARRGVRVRLLLQGRYEYFMQYHAARPVYGTLLAAGVEIYEYDASFLHAKVAVVDPDNERPWATVGSSNLDPLSLLLAREANVVVADRQFAQQLHRRLIQVIASQSTPVSATFGQRHWRQRLRDRLAFGLMRMALFLTGHRY